MSANNDRDNDLIVVVSYLLKRQVRMPEALSALGISRSTYYEQRDKGVLNSVANLMLIADHFDLDKVDLLVRFGHLSNADLITYLERAGELASGEPETGADPQATTTLRKARKQAAPRRRNRPRARTDIPTL
ncbi:hypothetical protein [Mycolicibacterium sphagni]|nr:hypothetical protein [Mycolicibacterium sphagni]